LNALENLYVANLFEMCTITFFLKQGKISQNVARLTHKNIGLPFYNYDRLYTCK